MLQEAAADVLHAFEPEALEDPAGKCNKIGPCTSITFVLMFALSKTCTLDGAMAYNRTRHSIDTNDIQ